MHSFRTLLFSSVCLASLGVPAAAEAPRVVADIAPLHGLVSSVMAGVGVPDLVIPPGASPHGYAMRPSEARALSEAEIVFWIGPMLTPWLEEPIETLAKGAHHVRLSETPGLLLLDYREGAAFEAHDHADDHGGHDEHGEHDEHAAHEDHADEAHEHDEHKDHDDHDDHAEKADDHGHDHDHEHEAKEAEAEHGHEHDHDHAGGLDGHLWLDPDNAVLMLGAIAEKLAATDPANAEAYRRNAESARTEIAALEEALAEQLAPFADAPFIVTHDSYHYFERSFGVRAVSSIALGDESGASAARLARVRDVVEETGARCALAEPRANAGLIDAVERGADIRIESLDAVGVDIPVGPGYYPALLRQIADGMTRCLAGD